MNQTRSLTWRILGILASIALGVACHHEWQVRFDQVDLGPHQETTTPVPRLIGFEPTTTITRGDTPEVHSASAIELPNGDLRCYWFGGTREGHSDVSIWTTRWDHHTENWGPPSVCLDRRWLEDSTGINIRKLGNPVASISDGKVELFVVGVSMGGWSGSAIYHLDSADEGQTFQNPRRLQTSPFLNVSTLVRTSPVPASAPGNLILPGYHEFVQKYPVRIGFNKHRDISFIAPSRQAQELIQPCEIVLNGTTHSFLRDCRDDGAVHLTTIRDSSTPLTLQRLPIPNPDSSVCALTLDTGVLLACNDTTKERDQLSLLFQTPDALTTPWHRIRTVESPERQPDEINEKSVRYSYPWLMQSRDGNLHLFYTWNHREIRHLRFDARDWPEELQPTAP